MPEGHFIRQDDKTTCGGKVLEADTRVTMFGIAHAREGDRVSCGKDNKIYIIMGGVSYIESHGKLVAGSLDSFSSCPCKAGLIPSEFTATYESDRSVVPHATRAATQPAAAVASSNPVAPRQSGFTSAPKSPTPTFSKLPGVICQNLWREYQQRAEAIVAPGGVLIADPKARNRAINAAYAQLWLADQRFQWAGLAAFASKQVGCGLLHAADSIEKIQGQHEAGLRRDDAFIKKLLGLFSWDNKREQQSKARNLEQAQRDYEQARRNNPLPGGIRNKGESLSFVQKQLQFVHDMLALGNTTLFLDVFPLHVFYKERGIASLKTCLPFRKNIYEHDQHSVLWPIEQETLEFGTNHDEILQAFEAIEAGNIAKSVERLAWHEQKNILQPSMYSDQWLVKLLFGNHFAYVTDFPSGAAAAVELTLASQCRPSEDGRTVGFSNDYVANLANIDQRMPFVLKAAEQFDNLLRRSDRQLIEQAILDIAAGRGVR
ncbi:hypothetical protein PS914_03831 [Pseudomonas fluorescens]|uniref:PAAR domain-containing protein n=1 Tax=Pseudomonas fluorescens TaxID=294 RepID=UPI0012419785|nr:PAAR domain-containing protein [Pseudomonas fluorescens]VVP98558.1 hypothetical protein PS914_03831 [Pseudomonas fluorescens]